MGWIIPGFLGLLPEVRAESCTYIIILNKWMYYLGNIIEKFLSKIKFHCGN